ncbi:M23 family metallopeptidase [Kitasatospora sp. NBC_01287]|uniref:M23 family metallopeptidase n=1 Tax=Kitasatospora sp. NBC_01287 TaxID=2903573 RepID=UPI00224DF4FC|nr:M23 family metallopeptidase [Kitasatospora sp. NBC_01287]MCX4748248.1 M23 family metallopeptidase [Kitasatospora sp. NBC_01287]
MDRTDAERERLRDYLTGPGLDHAIFAPGFVEAVGARRLTAIRGEARKGLGTLESIRPDGEAGAYLVDGRRGVVRAEVGVDERGLITLLALEPVSTGRPRSIGQRVRELLPVLVALLVAPAVVLIALGGALAGSWSAVLPALLTALALLVVCRLGTPWCWVSQHTRAVTAAAVLGLVVVGLVRLPGLPAGHLGWSGVVFPALTVLAAVAGVSGSREAPAERAPLLIANPLPGSRVLVGQGGGKAVNHHADHPDQRYALDLLCLGPRGARARGLAPRDLAAYRAYGAVVAAPCDATVVSVVDGLADQPVQASPFERAGLERQPVCGNHLVLRTEWAEDVHLVLAHLRAGSLLVAAGDRVTAGQPLAEVGNSGNTTEPHLHLHAEARTPEGTTPVRLRMVAHPGREPRRGRRLDH